MRLYILAAAIALSMVLVACVRPTLERHSYVGQIMQVQHREGEHYSLLKGEKPLTFISIRIVDGREIRGVAQVRILLLDLYTPTVYGGLHDTVSFVYSKRLPLSGEVWFDDLNAYKVTRQKE